MLALTFSTGIVDAVGVLGLDQVFTGNMTGNIVILGMGLAGADDLPVAGPAVALVGFMTGATLAGRVLKSAVDTGWTQAVAALIVFTAATESGIAAVLIAHGSGIQDVQEALTVGSLGVAMGGQAAAGRQVAVKDVTTVVVTSNLTALEADSMFGPGVRGGSRCRLAAVVSILLGAVVGAVLLEIHIGIGLIAAGTVTTAVAALGYIVDRAGHRADD